MEKIVLFGASAGGKTAYQALQDKYDIVFLQITIMKNGGKSYLI